MLIALAVGDSNSVATVKEKRFVGIQRKPAVSCARVVRCSVVFWFRGELMYKTEILLRF